LKNERSPEVAVEGGLFNILSFGGYLAVPVALACKLKSIPIVTHEQTRVLGFANKMVAFLADKVALSFKETSKFLDKNSEFAVTGNPLRTQILNKKAKKPKWLAAKINKPILLIMGGNQGSLFINDFVKNNLEKLAKQFIIVHQCGRDNKLFQYKTDLLQAAEKLLGDNQERYFPMTWIEDEDLAWIYAHSKLALARSGANTVLELAAVCLPMILLPLPFSHLNEQEVNAVWIDDIGGGILIKQDDFNYDSFNLAASKILKKHKEYQVNLNKAGLIKDAPDKIYQLMQSLVIKK